MTATLTKPPVDIPAEPEQPRRKRDVGGFLGWVATHSLGLALGLMFATPVVFVFLTAVMSDDQAFTSDLWPRSGTGSNFIEVFDKAPLFQYLVNSLTYSLLATLRHAALVDPGGVRAREAQVARTERRVPAGHRRDDAAAAGRGRAAVRHVVLARASRARCGR